MIFDRLYLISTLKGTNDKKALLRSWYDNDKDLCLKVMKFLYDPNIVTNLSSKKINKDLGVPLIADKVYPLSDSKILQTMDYLVTHCTGTDEDIKYVQTFLSEHILSIPLKFAQDFFCKELSIGLDIKSINAVIPNAITMIMPMLATNIANMKVTEYETKEYAITMKLDGQRCLIDTRSKPFKAYSRNGVIVEGLKDFLEELENNLPIGYIFDGELLPQNVDNLNSNLQFKEISTLMRLKGEKDKNKICYNVFDFVHINKIYKDRRDELESIIKESKYCKIVPILYQGKISEKVFQLLDEVTSKGNEGLMGNYLKGLYSDKRTKDIVKFKKFMTVDVKCIGIEEGTKKFEGTLGALLVDYKGYTVKVGTGFTDELRKLYFTNPNEIVDKIIEVQYFAETTDKHGNISLRFPVFVRIREDKTEVSYE